MVYPAFTFVGGVRESGLIARSDHSVFKFAHFYPARNSGGFILAAIARTNGLSIHAYGFHMAGVAKS